MSNKNPFNINSPFIRLSADMQKAMKAQRATENFNSLFSGIRDWSKMAEEIAKPYDLATKVVMGGSTITTLAMQVEALSEINKKKSPTASLLSLSNSWQTQRFINEHYKSFEAHLALTRGVSSLLGFGQTLGKLLTPVNYVNKSGYTPLDVTSGTTFINSFEFVKGTNFSFQDIDYISEVEEIQSVVRGKPEIIQELQLKVNFLVESVKIESELFWEKIVSIWNTFLDDMNVLMGNAPRRFILYYIIFHIICSASESKIQDAVWGEDASQITNITIENHVHYENNEAIMVVMKETDVYNEKHVNHSIECLNPGTRIKVLSMDGEWTCIQYDLQTEPKQGWVKDLVCD